MYGNGEAKSCKKKMDDQHYSIVPDKQNEN